MRLLSKIVLRSIASTAVICFMALLAGAFRLHRLDFAGLRKIAIENWQIAVMVFLGAVVWEFWFRRVATREALLRETPTSKSLTRH